MYLCWLFYSNIRLLVCIVYVIVFKVHSYLLISGTISIYTVLNWEQYALVYQGEIWQNESNKIEHDQTNSRNWMKIEFVVFFCS